jgi:phosphinothricin acetyltransferase
MTMLTSPNGNSPGIDRLRDVAGVVVRPAKRRDLPRLNDLYNHYIVHTAITFDLEPWSLEQREEWFGHYAPTGRHRLLVAQAGDVVLGYASTSQFRPRPAYETTVEVSVVCAPEAVGLGIGQRLYDVLFESVRGEDIHMAVAAITLPNSGSCALHERFGFTRLCVLREVGRKFDQYWDVVWYERRMG